MISHITTLFSFQRPYCGFFNHCRLFIPLGTHRRLLLLCHIHLSLSTWFLLVLHSFLTYCVAAFTLRLSVFFPDRFSRPGILIILADSLQINLYFLTFSLSLPNCSMVNLFTKQLQLPLSVLRLRLTQTHCLQHFCCFRVCPSSMALY